MTPGLSDFYVSTILRKRKPKQLSEARLDVREETVHEHFGMLSNVVLKYGVDLKPHCIYNMDETGFSKDTNLQGKLLLPVGRKHEGKGAGERLTETNICLMLTVSTITR